MLLVSLFAYMHQASAPVPSIPGEVHLKNVRQLTFGGQNAEAYLDVAGKRLIYQSNQSDYVDEQVLTMNLDGSGKRIVSTGKGRCTCAYFIPRSNRIMFSSTHATQPGAQPSVDMSKGYVWMVNEHYALYSAKEDGSDLKPVIVKPGAYVAETTISPDGKYMVWTSDFEGDLEIYRSNIDGTNIKRLTNDIGYDGGPFISWDGKHIVYRRTHFTGTESVSDYKDLLNKHLVRPTAMDIWIMDADGKNKRQLTDMPGASFAPFMTPDNTGVIFSSNWEDPKGRNFDLYLLNLKSKKLERITQAPGFDGFPMFSKDGKKLVFASNRNATKPRETNVFIADWVK